MTTHSPASAAHVPAESTEGSGAPANPAGPTDPAGSAALQSTAPARGGVLHVRIREGQQHNFSAATGVRLPE